MRDVSLVAKASFLLGGIAMLLWLALQCGLVPRRSQRVLRHGHSHGSPMPLPDPGYTKHGSGRVVPDYGALPAFSLVDSHGAPLTRERLQGTVWVASFLFTRCGGTCPATASKVQVLQASLPEGAVLVSVTVDPERDTPEVLAAYASRYQRVEGRWLLATGETRQITELAQRGFYLGGGEALFHSTRLALVDQQARLRGFYESTSEAEMTRLLRDVSLLVADSPPES